MHHSYTVSHLEHLESEAIYVLREVVAGFQNPVLLFSGGKDSICVAHLARKAFRPASIPFPLMHVDTGHNFPETLAFRDRFVSELGVRLVVASVQDSIERGRVVEEPGPNPSRNSLQTVTLLDAINEHGFDAAIGGARRDEEKARAKERFFSHRDDFGQWDPRNQRPELWHIFTGKMNPGEHFCIFPLSNWTEMDVWQYIQRENIQVPSLYFSHKRKVVRRDGALLAVTEFTTLLEDARNGVIEQTCRHSFIASLLRIEHIVVAVNKMDLVDWSEERFNQVVADYKNFASRLHVPDIVFIPISALHGDNVVEPSRHMPWYRGNALLDHLETVYIGSDANHVDPRFPVQYVIRPHSDAWHDFRGYAGRVASGVFKPGDDVVALPSGFSSRIKAIYSSEEQLGEAFYPHSCVMTLEDDIDLSRGDMLVKPHNKPRVAQDIDAMICWFSPTQALTPGDRLLLLHTSREVTAIVKEIQYKVDVNTLHKIEDGTPVALNDIARIHLRVSTPLFFDDYSRNRVTGSMVLVNPFTHATVAGGMMRTTE